MNGLSSVRPADVAVAEAELHAADAEVDEARATLASAIVGPRATAAFSSSTRSRGSVSAPTACSRWAGRRDVRRRRGDGRGSAAGSPRPVGAHHRRCVAGAVAGTVEGVGMLVGTREVFRTDPTAFADSRVVHVRIRAADPARLSPFINARVTAVIQP